VKKRNPRLAKLDALHLEMSGESSDEESAPTAPGVVLENYTKVPNSGSKCVVCGAHVEKGFTRVPFYAQVELAVDHCLILPTDNSNCRICISHLEGGHLRRDITVTANYHASEDEDEVKEAHFESAEASRLIQHLLRAVSEYRKMASLDFNDESALSEEEYHLWTGLSKEQFNALLSYLPGVRTSSVRTKRDALAIFWMKMKTDLSFSHIGSLLGLHKDRPEAARLKTREAFYSVMEDLNTNFVPSHLGVGHMTQEEAMAHNTPYSSTFFGDKPTTIWDGTYLYTHRSSNYSIGRKFYSMHKGRELVKFMSVVLPDGYVLDMIGPFFSNASNNDAGMTIKILKEEGLGVLNWIKEGEQTIIVDRGFRNAVATLEELGNIEVKMPNLTKGKQDGVQEANSSRLVTKVRWVVEAYHGRFKKFRFFDNRQPVVFVQHYRSLLRILTAMLNRFRPPLFDASQNVQYHKQIAKEMLRRSQLDTNPVAALVTQGRLSPKGKQWTELDANEVDLNSSVVAPAFPKLTLEVIESKITFGCYQLKQAQHYADEHLSADGIFRITIHQADKTLIRARLQSRHQGSTKYFVWVRYTATQVTGSYCQCKAGNRVVGCCAHATTLIWYLGFARHNGYCLDPSYNRLREKVLDSKTVGSGFEDSDEEADPAED